MSFGVVHGSALVYAQYGTPEAIASYLLAIRFMSMISLFSQSPFYARIPEMNALIPSNRIPQLISIAQKGMRHAHLTFVAGFLLVGFASYPLLELVGSKTEFVSPKIWAILGLALFFERFGAMHIQLYSTRNRIIWHIANGVTGTITLLFMFFMFEILGPVTIPIAILLGNAGFYSWYSAVHSYREFGVDIWRFERSTSAIPLGLLLTYLLFALLFGETISTASVGVLT